jgi:hypothetical protein
MGLVNEPADPNLSCHALNAWQWLQWLQGKG